MCFFFFFYLMCYVRSLTFKVYWFSVLLPLALDWTVEMPWIIDMVLVCLVVKINWKSKLCDRPKECHFFSLFVSIYFSTEIDYLKIKCSQRERENWRHNEIGQQDRCEVLDAGINSIHFLHAPLSKSTLSYNI